MPSNHKRQGYGLILLLSIAVAGCMPATAKRAPDLRPAVLVGNGSCHEAIEAAMKTMTGADRIQLPPDLFRNKSNVLLSNHRPSEVLRDRPNRFSEAADKRFLLHIHAERCTLSLIDTAQHIIASQTLATCQCAPAP